jgi:hypothetical protein
MNSVSEPGKEMPNMLIDEFRADRMLFGVNRNFIYRDSAFEGGLKLRAR